MKRFFFAVVIVLPILAFGSAIKTWTTSDKILVSDLNANFTHLHANLGHAHGAIILNADIATNAAISHTKMATPALLPKAWAYVSATCSASPCTIAVSSGVTAINRTSAGLYTVDLTTDPADANFAVFVTSGDRDVGATTSTVCAAGTQTAVGAANFTVNCYDTAGTAQDPSNGFNVMVMDNL